MELSSPPTYRYNIENIKFWKQTHNELLIINQPTSSSSSSSIVNNNNNCYTINKFNSDTNDFDIIANNIDSNGIPDVIKRNIITNNYKNFEIVIEKYINNKASIPTLKIENIIILPQSKKKVFIIIIMEKVNEETQTLKMHKQHTSNGIWSTQIIDSNKYCGSHFMVILRGNNIAAFNNENRNIYIFNIKTHQFKLSGTKLPFKGSFKAITINDSHQDALTVFGFIRTKYDLFIPIYLQNMISTFYCKEELYLISISNPSHFEAWRFNADQLFQFNYNNNNQ